MRKVMRIPWRKGERGQAVVEFALMITMMTWLFLGTVDFARFMYYESAITNAARVGAEAASNHCENRQTCGETAGPSTDDLVVQQTVCESSSAVTLYPKPSSCVPCQPGASGCPSLTFTKIDGSSVTDPCSPCSQDVYVSPAYGAGTNPVAPSSPISVTVIVGYNFQPITPLLNQFFPSQTCYTGDTQTHTLCATAVGRINS
jgi:hypothetical protein